jgi:putative ABC transport system permease protein
MFKSYIKIAFRHIAHKKIHALINIIGLSLGIAGALFIVLWLRDELSYDRFHVNSERIYRVTQVFNNQGRITATANSAAVLAETVMQECPEVELVTRVLGYQRSILVKVGDNRFNDTRTGIADAAFFKVFSFPFVEGNPETSLAMPQMVVISQAAAKKYFGDSNPIGRTMTMHGKDFNVAGIFKNMPVNSHFHFDILCSFASFEQYQQPAWGTNVFKTYILLRVGHSADVLQKKLNDIVKTHIFRNYDEWEAKGNSRTMPLQPLTDIHLRSHLLWEFEDNGNSMYVQFLSIIVVFILLIAVINYTNLSTARSASRAREVGIRKTVGSTRGDLIIQFLAESVLTSFLSLILALVLVQMLMPAYRHLVGKPWLKVPFIEQPLFILVLGALTVLIGIMAGIYPSCLLSSSNPISAIRVNLGRMSKSSRLRNGLVVFQFSLSILLLVGTFVIQKQIDFVRNRNLNYEREHVVVVKTFEQLNQKLPAFKEALLLDPTILRVSGSTSVPGKEFDNRGFKAEGTTSNPGVNLIAVDADFMDALQIELKAGRFFSEDIPSDSQGLILNESGARAIGWKDPLNKRIEIGGVGQGRFHFHVIGIVKDFHYESLHEPVKPLGIIKIPGACGWSESFVAVKIRAENIRASIAHIRKTWEEFVPGIPMEYSFLDTIYNNMYLNEERLGHVFTIFTLFAIFVACLGLFGLALFSTEQRTKEIGIRKVLGAPVSSVIFLLSREFTKWVLIANFFAWPTAYFAMNRWLQNFAYRTHIGVLAFVLSGLLALLVALLTVGIQSVKAAIANPVDSLRYE